MSAAAKNPEIGRYEQAVDEVIATCGGDVRGALKALILANEFLEGELQAVCSAVSNGYGRGRLRARPGAH
jgi:hypothetical protein